MSITHFIDLKLIHINKNINSKKSALEFISESIHNNYPELDTYEIFDHFIKREQLGTTAIGHGVALPHARLENNKETIGVFVSLKNQIDFNALDHQPVQLLFALIIPQDSAEQHLQILSRLARFFHNEKNRHTLLHATSRDTVYELLSHLEKPD